MTTFRKTGRVKTRNQSYVKHYNIQTVLRVLEAYQPVSRTEIVRLTEISPTSITRIINALIKMGLIYETDSVPKSSRGRKAINLCIKEDGIYTLGVFLTHDSIRACLMDYGNHVIHSDIAKLEKRIYSPEELSYISYQMFRQIPEHLVRDWKCVCGLGISCSGIVDYSSGNVVESYQMHWRNVNLASAFANEFSLPVWVENDVRACLIGEKARKKIADDIDTVYLMVGTGVGVAATISGRIMRGFNSRAGEIENLSLSPASGRSTTLHEHLTESSLIERAAHFDPAIDSVSAIISNISKPWAREIIDDFKHYLSQIIKTIDSICAPRIIILGGTFITALTPYICDVCTPDRVIIGADYEDACVTGAAIVAMRGAIHALINEQIEICS